MIPASEIRAREELFTHVDDVTAKETTYAVSRLYAHVAANPMSVELVRVPVEAHHAEYLVVNRGVEEHRLLALKPEHFAKPIMFIAMPDQTHLLVDGTHRYVKGYALQIPELPAYIVPWTVAQAFTVSGLPTVGEQALRNMHSFVDHANMDWACTCGEVNPASERYCMKETCRRKRLALVDGVGGTDR